MGFACGAGVVIGKLAQDLLQPSEQSFFIIRAIGEVLRGWGRCEDNMRNDEGGSSLFYPKTLTSALSFEPSAGL
ncbi:unnamed protein product [Phytomonas sp. Hart1]|nr:unnamed protein product [Phytomonas sp. Hart1]|eukprot:CCW71683.1 unnamed protein product [Phytomonas sp. isolate Hart1]